MDIYFLINNDRCQKTKEQLYESAEEKIAVNLKLYTQLNYLSKKDEISHVLSLKRLLRTFFPKKKTDLGGKTWHSKTTKQPKNSEHRNR